MHTVAADRYAVARCLGGRSKPTSYAAAVRGIGLQVREFRSFTGSCELVNGVKVLAHREGHPSAFGDGGITIEIVGKDGFLEPREVVGREPYRCFDCRFDGHRVVGVDHQRCRCTYHLADSLHPRDIVVEFGAADFDFD